MTPGINDDARVAFHEDQHLDIENFKNLEEVDDFFNNNYMEGIVINYNGKYWKIVTNLTQNQKWKKLDIEPSIPAILVPEIDS